MNGYVDWNQLYSQMNPTGTLPQAMNSFLVNGYGNFGNQLQGAMNQMWAINNGNADRNVINNQTEALLQSQLAMANAQAAAARAPIEVEQMRIQSANNRLDKLSPLLSQLFGSIGGGAGGGQFGFKAVDADGNPFAQATSGGSTAQPTDTNRYRRAVRGGI